MHRFGLCSQRFVCIFFFLMLKKGQSLCKSRVDAVCVRLLALIAYYYYLRWTPFVYVHLECVEILLTRPPRFVVCNSAACMCLRSFWLCLCVYVYVCMYVYMFLCMFAACIHSASFWLCLCVRVRVCM